MIKNDMWHLTTQSKINSFEFPEELGWKFRLMHFSFQCSPFVYCTNISLGGLAEPGGVLLKASKLWPAGGTIHDIIMLTQVKIIMTFVKQIWSENNSKKHNIHEVKSFCTKVLKIAFTIALNSLFLANQTLLLGWVWPSLTYIWTSPRQNTATIQTSQRQAQSDRCPTASPPALHLQRKSTHKKPSWLTSVSCWSITQEHRYVTFIFLNHIKMGLYYQIWLWMYFFVLATNQLW